MSPEDRRKWLPSEAYRYLVLAVLVAGGEASLSKRELAWQTRANHYMITRVLAQLHENGLVRLDARPDGYGVQATPAGREFVQRHRDYIRTTFGPMLEAHFRFGRPNWARF